MYVSTELMQSLHQNTGSEEVCRGICHLVRVLYPGDKRKQ